jgi:hypothetical protein
MEIKLSRCEMGSGGWSLAVEKEDGEWIVLTSGPGRMVRGEWAPPPRAAYASAREKCKRLGIEISR